MRARIAGSVGLWLGLLGSHAGAGESPSTVLPARLGLPSPAGVVVRAQDEALPPLAPPQARQLPTLGRPVKVSEPAPTTSVDEVAPARFVVPAPLVQEPAPMPMPSATPAPSQPSVPATPITGSAPPPPWAGSLAEGCLGTGCYDCGSHAGHLYGSAEYLVWWFRDLHSPPLATLGTPASGGILGREGTVILYGGNVDTRTKQGGRFTLGYWCDDCNSLGVEATFFFLAKDTDGFEAFSAGSPVLARPFANVLGGAVPGTPIVLTPGEDAELVAFPNALAGNVNVRITSEMWGAELNARKSALCGTGPHCITYNVDALAGARYLNLEETLSIHENLVTIALPSTENPTPLGTNIEIYDSFRTRNQFFGGQVGAVAEFRRGPIFLDLRGKLGIGVNRQTVNVDGVTIIRLQDGTTAAGTGGLLAQPTNIGRYRNNEFSLLPELNATIGYQVNDWLRVFGGYSILYWTNVVRPGDQIDRGLNPSQRPTLAGPGALVGPARPLYFHNQRDFWLQGFNLGLELRY